MSQLNIYNYSKWSKKILVYQLDTVYGYIQARLESLHIRNTTHHYTQTKTPDLNGIIGIIISGSRVETDIPDLPKWCIKSRLPKLGICFGHEILAWEMGAGLEECNVEVGERGGSKLKIEKSPLFRGLDTKEEYIVDMNHKFEIKSLPPGFTPICSTRMTEIAGYQNLKRGIFGVQFHPERSSIGDIIFKNFYEICLDSF